MGKKKTMRILSCTKMRRFPKKLFIALAYYLRRNCGLLVAALLAMIVMLPTVSLAKTSATPMEFDYVFDIGGEPGRKSGKPNLLKNFCFGEQHMHSRNSLNAFTAGVTMTWREGKRK